MTSDFSSTPEDATLRVPANLAIGDATLRVNTAPETPMAPPEDATLRAPREDEPEISAPISIPTRQLPLGVLAPGAILCSDCVVRETIRPHETMRPGLYDCDAPEGRVMVKIAASEHPPREDLWHRLPSLKHPALLRTHRVLRERGFFAEVQEFCEGGTLDDCAPKLGRTPLPWEHIERGVVASFLAGISYLHNAGVVHRDVKPKNLYLRKNGGKVALVIADFDISSVIESDHTSRDTPRGAGTHFYMAPEAFPRFVDPSAGRAAAIVSPASDFYSFGVVLVELLVGTTALHSGRWSDVYDFYMSGGRLEIPADLPPRARELIQGLLIRNRRTRWGSEEVRRWLENATTDADRQKIRDDAGFELVRRAARPYNVFKSSPSDIPSLARAMLDEPSVAEEELMSGDVLVNWLGELDAKLAREVRRDRENYRHFPRVAYMSALMRLDPTLPFVVSPGYAVTSWDEWETQIDGWVKAKKIDLAAAVGRSTLMKLETWLRLQSDANPSAADAVARMRVAWWENKPGSTLNPLDVRVAWEEMRWLRDPLRPFNIAPGVAARTPAEIARLCYGQNSDWSNGVPSLYRAALEKWKEGSLGAWLRQRACDADGNVSPVVAQIENLRHKNNFAPEATWETVLRMLDPNLPRVPLQFLPGGLGQGLVAEAGEMMSRTVSFEALGPGLPFGVWKLEDAPPGMSLSPLVIDQRRGQLRIDFNTLGGLEPGSAGRAQIALEKGGTCTLEAPLGVSYRVKLPDTQKKLFIRNGVLLGASIAGGTRLIAFLMTGTQWIPPDERPDEPVPPAPPVAGNPNLVVAAPAVEVDEDPIDQQPPISYIGAGMTLFLGVILGFYVWLNALRKYARR
ncbi:MAG TPA: protein kinase [Abditibacterium sp.]|jgi:hypothetical protein